MHVLAGVSCHLVILRIFSKTYVITRLLLYYISYFLPQQVGRHRDIALLYKDRWLKAEALVKSTGVQSEVSACFKVLFKSIF